MALQPTVTPYLKKFAANNVRTFAAAAAKKKDGEASGNSPANPYFIPREELKVSKTSNNITVASVETNKPLAKIAVYLRAGSRFETDETQGVTQMLRLAAGLGTTHASQFATTRNLEENGANLSCTTGREFICYTLETARNNLNRVDKYIKELAGYQVFKPWEIKDNVNRMRLERTIRPPEVRILELIHKSAYRKGLGYSLYSPKWMIGNHSSEMLANFVKNNFVEASVVGVGVHHDELRAYASRLPLPDTARTIQKSTYHAGSELRKETNVGLAYVALAIEGASFVNQKEQMTSALVQRALGAGARTKRGDNLGGKLSTVLSGDVSLKAGATTFSSNYADSGLLGIFIAATPCSANGVTKKAAEVLLSGNIADADVARAKSLLKADIAYAMESDGGYLEEIGLQTLLTGGFTSQDEINSVIDSVTAAEMNSMLTKGKLTMAAFGNIANVPYLDQLKK